MSDSRSGLQLVFCIVAVCSMLGCPLESVRTDPMCAGHCGEYLNDWQCGCDMECEGARDCCPGYELICAPDKGAAGGQSPTCEPSASGSSQTCEVRDPETGVIEIPTETLRTNGLK